MDMRNVAQLMTEEQWNVNFCLATNQKHVRAEPAKTKNVRSAQNNRMETMKSKGVNQWRREYITKKTRK